MPNEDILSLTEAKDHVENNLKITNFEEKVKKDRLSALNELVRATLAYYPFQNIDLLAAPGHLRRVPTYSDIRESFLVSRKGGLCIAGNTFTQHVIIHFGYDSYLAGGMVNHELDHCVIIVKDLVKPGDLHLVDVACGFPTLEAIPLNGEGYAKIYQHSFLTFTIVKSNDGSKYHRYHLKGDDRSSADVDSEGRILYYAFDLEPRSHQLFEKSMHDTFTNPEESIFLLRKIFVTLYRPGKGFTLKENELRIFDEEKGTCRTSTKLETFEDFSNALHNVMKVPVVDDKELKIALDVYYKFKSLTENNNVDH